MRIIKNDHSGKQVWEYEGKIIEKTPSSLLVEAYFNRSDLLFNGVLLREGDRFLELYIAGRWFNIYEVHDRDSDAIKAWYCNITRPVKIEKEKLSYDDLALDLLVYPDRSILALDEDEFISLPLDYTDTQNARNGLEELKEIFSRKKAFQMQDYKEFI
jgi:hypothetical protein